MKRFRSLRELRTAALLLMTAVVGCGLGVDFLLLTRASPEAPAVVGLFVLPLAALAFFAWVHRAASNVEALGRRLEGYTPASCIWWWFVPIANIFRPSLAVQEIWRQSGIGVAPVPSAVPPRVKIVEKWWAAWLFGNVLLNVSLQTRDRQASAFLGLASTLLMIAALCFAARVMLAIEEGQKAVHARLQGGAGQEPLWEYRERGAEGDGVPITLDGLLRLCERDPRGMAGCEFRGPGAAPWQPVAPGMIRAARSRLAESTSIVCPACAARLILRRVDDVPGRRARCNQCGGLIVLGVAALRAAATRRVASSVVPEPGDEEDECTRRVAALVGGDAGFGNKDALRHLGAEVHAHGGIARMRRVYAKVRERGIYFSQDIWHGIGEWRS